MKQDTMNAILEHKIITIARGIPVEDILPTAHALYDGGIRLMEVTFNQASPSCIEDTARSIELICKEFGGEMLAGAGTVMTEEQADAAYQAGGQYLISPVFDPKVIKKANDYGIVSIPAALTPTEIAMAYQCGGDLIKLFPAGNFGLDYIKAIMAPLNHIPLLAVGGVDENNIGDFLKIGLKGAGIGSGIVKKKLIAEKKFDEITRLARVYTDAVR